MTSGIHWLSVVLAYSTLFLLGLADNIRGPLYPELLQNLQLSDGDGAWLWGLTSTFAFVGSMLAPRVMRRQGLLPSLKWALLLMIIGQLGMSFCPSYIWALGACVFFGLSLGLMGVVQNLLVLRAGPERYIQKLQAGLHSNYAGASLLAPLLLSALAMVFPGWRAGYLAGACVTGLGFFALFRFSNSDLPNNQPPPIEENFDKIGKTMRKKFSVFAGSWLAVIFAFYVAVEILVSSRLALLLQRQAHFDFQSASLATTLFFTGLFVGRLLFTFWHPPLKLKTQLLLSLFGSILLMFLGLLNDPRWLVLTGLTMAPFYPLAMAYLGEKFPQHLGEATALAVSLSSVFVVTMHIAVGQWTEHLGISKALFVGPLFALLAFIMLAVDHRVIESSSN